MSVAGSKIAGEIFGIVLIASSILFAISLYSHNPADPSFNSYATDSANIKNMAGVIGSWGSDLLIQSAGSTAVILPFTLFFLGTSLILRTLKPVELITSFAGLIIVTVSASAFVHLYWPGVDPIFASPVPGGAIGELMTEKMTMPWFSRYGSYVIWVSLLVSGILLLLRVTLSEMTEIAYATSQRLLKLILDRAARAWNSAKHISMPSFNKSLESRKIKERKVKIRERELARELADEVLVESGSDPALLEGPEIMDFSTGAETVYDAPPPLPDPASLRKGKNKSSKKDKPDELFQQEIFSGDGAGYTSPSLDLLDCGPKIDARQGREELTRNSRILEKKLEDFGIKGRVKRVSPGPVITVFEFAPDPGVKVARIVSLADDLAMTMRAMSIRIVAPIPGKDVVGIEIPNPTRESVFLKEMLESTEFEESDCKIPLALGKDIGGEPLIADLATVPHLLIAGSTGSGKSVGINTMICSMLYSMSPSELKFIMVDPKMLELSIYDGIPHLIAPVVTNAKKAAGALKWVVGEMERRYAVLSGLGVRNIESHNRLVSANLKEMARKGLSIESVKAEAEENPDKKIKKEYLTEKLPFIVVVIDELADLMMVASKNVEESLARLAQMARASGIHLIVATQRPSVDVLTGMIKANFPARISFQVRSRVDSRTIIDSMGAEKLLGKGDMLFLPPGASGLKRIQAPFVSDEEIHRLVNSLKEQSAPEYNEDILKPVEDEAGAPFGDEEDEDEFYGQAVELVAQTRNASISMIQRRLRIGYNRAARIVETMENQGLVGPADGSKPREVFIRDLESSATEYN